MNAPFINEILGLVIVKIIDRTTHSTVLLKLKFMHNTVTLDIANNGSDIKYLSQKRC